jgi:hypothetical protein
MAETGKTSSTPRPGDARASGLSMTREVEDIGHTLLEEGADLGSAMLAVVQDNASAFFYEQRNRAADEIGALGELLHNSVRSMERRDGIVARCAGETAAQIEGFADRLRARSWHELTGDVEELARRYPLSFLSAAAGMGFLAVRLLTASGAEGPDEPGQQSTPLRTTEYGERGRGIMAGEAEIVAGVSGGAAAEHDAGTGKE